MTPSNRTALFGQFEHLLDNDIQLHGRMMYGIRKSTNQAAPEPLWVGNLSSSSNPLDLLVIDAMTPFNPFGFDLGPSVFINRRPIESGPRIFEQSVHTRYLNLSADRTLPFGSRPFSRAANVIRSENVAQQTKEGAHNTRRMAEALGTPDVCATIPGCVPLSFLGGLGTITQPMADFVGFVQCDSSWQKLWSMAANLYGDIAELPAGSLAFAAGIEHRHQQGQFDPDPIVARNETAGLPAEPTSRDFSVSEIYGELTVPVLEDAQ